MIPEEKIAQHRPKIAIMDENNRIQQLIVEEPAHTVL